MAGTGKSVREKPLLVGPSVIWKAPGRDWLGGGQSIARRRAMVRATARRIVAEKGIAGLHMRDLADNCGISVQTLYNNFGSRDAILLSAINEHCEANLARVWEEATETGSNAILVAADLATRLAAADSHFTRELMTFFERSGMEHPLATNAISLYMRSHLKTLRIIEARNGLRPWIDCEVAVRGLQRLMISMLLKLVSDDGATYAVTATEYHTAVGVYLLGLVRGEEEAQLENALVRLMERDDPASPGSD